MPVRSSTAPLMFFNEAVSDICVAPESMFDIGWAMSYRRRGGSIAGADGTRYTYAECLGSLECPRCDYTARPIAAASYHCGVREALVYEGKGGEQKTRSLKYAFCRGACFENGGSEVLLEHHRCDCVFKWKEVNASENSSVLFSQTMRHDHRQVPLKHMTHGEKIQLNRIVVTSKSPLAPKKKNSLPISRGTVRIGILVF
jgi:uncharacterized C2H2 Zn-finger protein